MTSVTFLVYQMYGFSKPSLIIIILPNLFALRAYEYFGLDPIVLLEKYLFIFVGITTRCGYRLLIYLD